MIVWNVIDWMDTFYLILESINSSLIIYIHIFRFVRGFMLYTCVTLQSLAGHMLVLNE